MSNQPSEAALAFAGKLQEACLLDVNLYDLLQDDVARLLDAFAAQAVAAERARWHNIETTPAPNGIDVEGWDSQYKRPVIINSSFQAVSEEGEEKAWALWTEYQDDYPVSMGGTISHWRYIVPPEEAQP